MSDTREKKQDPSPKVRDLMSGFESGKILNGNQSYPAEKPVAKPGGAKLLKQQFEKQSEQPPAPEVVRRAPRTPTSPTPPSPSPATADEKPAPATKDEEEQTPATNDEPQPSQTTVEEKPAESPKPAETVKPASSAPAPKGKPKNVLIVYADMEISGFNKEVLDITVDKLTDQGLIVEVSDLYRNKFDPCPTRLDAGVTRTGGNFLYEESMLAANVNRKVADDIKSEQDKITKADFVIFIFRLLPSGFPAMLQGYFNRVLSEGFGGDFTSKAIFEKGKLAGKKALLCMSCLLSADSFRKSTSLGDLDNAFGELDKLLFPLQYGTLRYSGFDVMKPQLNDDYYYGGDTQQTILLKAWASRLDQILAEKPLNFA